MKKHLFLHSTKQLLNHTVIVFLVDTYNLRPPAVLNDDLQSDFEIFGGLRLAWIFGSWWERAMPECQKGINDKVQRSEGPPAGSRSLEGPRLLVIVYETTLTEESCNQ